jgi:hypothetical protein
MSAARRNLGFSPPAFREPDPGKEGATHPFGFIGESEVMWRGCFGRTGPDIRDVIMDRTQI